MGLLSTITNWIARQWKTWRQPSIRKGIGERVFSAGNYGYGGFGGYGWGQGGEGGNRVEQVRHFKHWSFIAIRAICNRAAGLEPMAAHVSSGRQPRGYAERRFSEYVCRKSLGAVRPHEQAIPIGDQHPLARLFRKPNAWDTSGELWYEVFLFLELCGIVYLWGPPSEYGLRTGLMTPAELWVIPSQWVRPRWGDKGAEEYFVTPTPGGRTWMIPPSEIITLRYKSPLSKIDGHAPQQAGSEWIDAAESVDRTRFWSFKNAAMPAGAIELDQQYADPDDAELDRIYDKVFARLQGENNYGRPVILPPGAKFVPLTIGPPELSFIQSAEQLRDFTLALFQVPKEIAGIQPAGSEISWYAPLRQFVENCLGPKLHYLGEALTRFLAPRYSDDLRIWWEDPTPDDPEKLNRDLALAAVHGQVTSAEFRASQGREPFSEEEEAKYSKLGAQQQQPPKAPGMGGFGAGGSATGGTPQGMAGTRPTDLSRSHRNGVAKTWEEGKHPRADDGKFGEGSGDHSATAEAASKPSSSAEAAPAKEKKAARSKAKVKLGPEVDKKRLASMFGKMFGYDAPLEIIADCVGAPDDAEVTVSLSDTGKSLDIEMRHPAFAQTCTRYVTQSEDGKVTIHNESIFIKKEEQGSGLGSRIFSSQVVWAREHGVANIKCHAAKLNDAGEAYYNGYVTWPKLGYDAPLEQARYERYEDFDVAEEAARLFSAETVQDVLEAPGGLAWWEKNGIGLVEATFDLSPDSRSSQIHHEYLKRRAARPPRETKSWRRKKSTSTKMTRPLWTRSGQASPAKRVMRKKATARTKGDYRESDHPRADDGKFGEGAGISKKPATKRPKRKEPKRAEPMADHPLAGRSHDEMTRELASLAASRAHDPWKLAGRVINDAIDERAVGAEVSRKVEAAASGPRPRVNEVYAAIAEATPALSLADFQAILVRMHQDGKVRLHPFTGPPSTIPVPEATIPYGGQLNYTVGAGGKRMPGGRRKGAFREGDHPRANDGKFGEGGGGSEGGAAKKPATANESKPKPKSKLGKVARAVKEHVAVPVWNAIKKAGHKAAHVEHVVTQFISEGIPERIAAIKSTAMRAGVSAVWWMTKLGTKAAFVTYMAGQNMAQQVASAAGASDEQASRLRKVCTAIDLAGAKAVPMTLAAIGLGPLGAAAGSMVPIGSAAYLAYASVRNPVRVLRAAKGAIGALLKKGPPEPGSNFFAGEGTKAMSSPADDVKALHEALVAHEGDGGWFEALVYAALDESKSLAEALALAEAASAEK